MKTYVGALMNSFTDINRVRIDGELIDSIIRNQPKVPVTINFGGRIVGETRAFLKKDGSLYCEFDLETEIPNIERGYIVPGLDDVRFHYDFGTRVIDWAIMTEVSISMLPSNQSLERIRLKTEQDNE